VIRKELGLGEGAQGCLVRKGGSGLEVSRVSITLKYLCVNIILEYYVRMKNLEDTKTQETSKPAPFKQLVRLSERPTLCQNREG
jgi:hypothetical protein